MLIDFQDKVNITYLILQFLDEEHYSESFRLLQQESKLYFDIGSLSDLMAEKKHEEAEKYISTFMDDEESTKSFLSLCHLKYQQVSERCLEPPRWEDLYSDIGGLVQTNLHLQTKLFFPNLNRSALVMLMMVIIPCSFDDNDALLNVKGDLVPLVLGFLRERNYHMTHDKLVVESNCFDLDHFLGLTAHEKWDEADKYLVNFTAIYDNRYSSRMFIGLQKLRNPRTPNRETIRACIEKLAADNPALKHRLYLRCNGDVRLENLIKKGMNWWLYFKELSEVARTVSLVNMPTVPKNLIEDTASGDEPSTSNEQPWEDTARSDQTRQIFEQSHCQTTVLPDGSPRVKIARLGYFCSGGLILALLENGEHKIWLWESDEYLWSQPRAKPTMRNEVGENVQNAVSCIGLMDRYLLSLSGAGISIFNMMTLQRLLNIATNPTPAATYFTFIPHDKLAIGFDNGSILLYSFKLENVGRLTVHQHKKPRLASSRTHNYVTTLKGHGEKITCLAFSETPNILVSSGADSILCLWSMQDWQLLHRVHTGAGPPPKYVQFDRLQQELLVVHDRSICIYKGVSLTPRLQWTLVGPQEYTISSATYACDGDTIYVTLQHGFIVVLLTKTLKKNSCIHPTAYRGTTSSSEVHAIAAHPLDPNQIALGMSDGRIFILEPLDSQLEW